MVYRVLRVYMEEIQMTMKSHCKEYKTLPGISKQF